MMPRVFPFFFLPVRAVARVALFCVFLACAAGCGSELPAGTVATVNGRPISVRLLNAVHDTAIARGPGTAAEPSVDALRREYGAALATLIVHNLVAQDLRERGLEVTPEQVQAEEARIREDYPGGEFEQALLEEQIDLQTWRELLYNHLSLERFADRVIMEELRPTAVEIQAYYDAHKKDFAFPASVYLRVISGEEQKQVEAARGLLTPDSSAPLPRGVYEQKLALPKNALPEEWRKDLESLSPGAASRVRRVEGQYHMVQLLENLPETRMDVVEAYPLIEKTLKEEKTDAAYAAWIEAAVVKADIRVSVHLRPPHP